MAEESELPEASFVQKKWGKALNTGFQANLLQLAPFSQTGEKGTNSSASFSFDDSCNQKKRRLLCVLRLGKEGSKWGK